MLSKKWSSSASEKIIALFLSFWGVKWKKPLEARLVCPLQNLQVFLFQEQQHMAPDLTFPESPSDSSFIKFSSTFPLVRNLDHWSHYLKGL